MTKYQNSDVMAGTAVLVVAVIVGLLGGAVIAALIGLVK